MPDLQEGVAAFYQPHEAMSEHMEALGFPGQLIENWQERTVAKLGELLKKYRSLRTFLDLCVKCGSCTDKCHYYLGTRDPKNMPVARQELLRKIYRRYFTLGGKIYGGLADAEDMTEEVLKDWYTYFHQCSQCRRCAVFCPLGIDTAEISMAAREIMDTIGRGHRYVTEVIGKVYDLGNNLGIPEPALKNSLEFLEEDVKEETGVAVKFPLDIEGAEVFLVVPSADFFSEPHVASLIGYAKVFHQAGISWTLSSYASEFANFGLFIGNYSAMQKVARRIADAARSLKAKQIVVGECGHAYRVAYSFWNTLVGPFDFLNSRYPAPRHICEVTKDLVAQGALRLDKSANDESVVTFHDPCNVARASRMGNRPGGQFEIPRALIRASCNRFVDMAGSTIKEKT
ncbi:MAG: (Fe-S)-binding protein, partial [Candidatus Binatia bacterium]|nr:(Fe-S)-binding protein [Candidatus Binatia bacterium]